MKAIAWLCPPCAQAIRARRDAILARYQALSKSHYVLIEAGQATLTEDRATEQAIAEVWDFTCLRCRHQPVQGDA